jgi:hypothetical protein
MPFRAGLRYSSLINLTFFHIRHLSEKINLFISTGILREPARLAKKPL